MAFVGSSDFSIKGSAHVHVQRDQNINYTTQIIQQKKDRTIYDEFYDVKLGAICRAQDIHRENYPRRWDNGEREWWEEGLFRVNRTICTAKIRGQHGSKFTVVSYNGPEAKEAWRKDFRRFSRTTDSVKMQLFGINRSSVPLLIFYGDLLPLAHVWDRIGLFGKTYVGALTVSMDCDVSELWIDPKEGRLIHGVKATDRHINQFSFRVNALSSSVRLLLQEDVCFSYFSQLPLVPSFDRAVINIFSFMTEVRKPIPFDIHAPYIHSGLPGSMVATGDPGDWKAYGDTLHSQILMPNGGTRFTLEHRLAHSGTSFILRLGSWSHRISWLTQSSSIINNYGTSSLQDPPCYDLITSNIELRGSFSKDEANPQLRLESHPIYLFLHPLHCLSTLEPMSCVSVHSWSSDKNGKTCFSDDYCEHLGLPTEFVVMLAATHKLSWPSETYQIIHKWQIARGFDPYTTDFARYLGYQTYRAIQPKLVELEVVDAEETKESIGTSGSVVESPQKEVSVRSKFGSIWSALTSSLVSAECEEEEISVGLM